jgi:hypothetical protein
MKHLRKFNEAYGDECSFEEFKEIMLSILDDFNFDYDFNDFTDDSFYDCAIYVQGKEEYEIHDDIPSMNINFLDFREDSLLPPYDEPEEITKNGIDDCINSINYNIDELNILKNNLDGIIKYQKDCSKLFESIKLISDKFNNFSNCEHCSIGFNRGDLRITFEIKDEN